MSRKAAAPAQPQLQPQDQRDRYAAPQAHSTASAVPTQGPRAAARGREQGQEGPSPELARLTAGTYTSPLPHSAVPGGTENWTGDVQLLAQSHSPCSPGFGCHVLMAPTSMFLLKFWALCSRGITGTHGHFTFSWPQLYHPFAHVHFFSILASLKSGHICISVACRMVFFLSGAF